MIDMDAPKFDHAWSRLSGSKTLIHSVSLRGTAEFTNVSRSVLCYKGFTESYEEEPN